MTQLDRRIKGVCSDLARPVPTKYARKSSKLNVFRLFRLFSASISIHVTRIANFPFQHNRSFFSGGRERNLAYVLLTWSEQSEQSEKPAFHAGPAVPTFISRVGTIGTKAVKLPTSTQPIPYDLILIWSRVLGRDVAIVRNQFIPAPDGAVKLTWKEAMALIESDATPTDLPRLMRIRDLFSDGSDSARFEPAGAVAGIAAQPGPAPAPGQTPAVAQLELF